MTNLIDAVVPSEKKTSGTIVLHNGCRVQSKLLESIRRQVMRRVPTLPANSKFTLAMICGPHYWDDLSKGENIGAGWCMAHLVALCEVPLIQAEHHHEYPKFYRLP